MSIWQVLEATGGIALLLMGVFKKEFTPAGITTMLIWGSDKDARIPRWVARPFYVLLGLLLLYLAITGTGKL